MQGLAVSALTTASAATSSQFPHQNTLSNLPMTSALIDEFHVPGNMREIDPMPKMMGDHILTLSQFTTLLEDVAMSTLSGNKHKFCPTIHSAPTSVISAVHLAPTTFNTPHLLLSLSLGTKHHKTSLSGSPVLLHPLSSSSARGCSGEALPLQKFPLQCQQSNC